MILTEQIALVLVTPCPCPPGGLGEGTLLRMESSVSLTLGQGHRLRRLWGNWVCGRNALGLQERVSRRETPWRCLRTSLSAGCCGSPYSPTFPLSIHTHGQASFLLCLWLWLGGTLTSWACVLVAEAEKGACG